MQRVLQHGAGSTACTRPCTRPCTLHSHGAARQRPSAHPAHSRRPRLAHTAAARHDWSAAMGADAPGNAAKETSTSGRSQEQTTPSPSATGSTAVNAQHPLSPAARRALMRATTISTVLAVLAVLAVPLLFLHDTAKEVCATLTGITQRLRSMTHRHPHSGAGSSNNSSSSGDSDSGSAHGAHGSNAANQERPLAYVVELTLVPLAIVLLRQWSHEPSRAACLRILAFIVLHAYIRCARATLHAIPSGVAGLVFGALELLCAGMRLAGFAALLAVVPTWLDVALTAVCGATWLVAAVGLVTQGSGALLQGSISQHKAASAETHAGASGAAA